MGSHKHTYNFTDRNQNSIACDECHHRVVLKSATRRRLLAQIIRQGEWAGQALPMPTAEDRGPVFYGNREVLEAAFAKDIS